MLKSENPQIGASKPKDKSANSQKPTFGNGSSNQRSCSLQQNQNNVQSSAATAPKQLQIPDVSTSNISFINKVPRVSKILLGSSSPLPSVSSGSIIPPVPGTPLVKPSFGPSSQHGRQSFVPSTPSGKQSIVSSTKSVKKTVSEVIFIQNVERKKGVKVKCCKIKMIFYNLSLNNISVIL